MKLVDPVKCVVAVGAGTMTGGTGRYAKRMGDLAGLYEDAAAFAEVHREMGDAVVYEVTEFRPSAAPGDMIFGVTRMRPGRVGREFFLTRGHIHERADRPEIYYGQQGVGLMQLESPLGETRIVEIGPQTICYVPPHWIHRSVNTGTTDLVMVFSYPADSGQDYGVIERSGGMRHRVFATAAGGWELVGNAAYRPRPPEVVHALMQPAA